MKLAEILKMNSNEANSRGDQLADALCPSLAPATTCCNIHIIENAAMKVTNRVKADSS